MKSLFNKPYKTDEELMDEKNISEFVRQQLLDNGEITINEILEFWEREPTHQNKHAARMTVLGKSVKGRLEKEGHAISCENGRYFIVTEDSDAENESQKRTSRAIAHIKTTKRGNNAMRVSNPEMYKKYLANEKEVLLNALMLQTKNEIKELKGE